MGGPVPGGDPVDPVTEPHGLPVASPYLHEPPPGLPAPRFPLRVAVQLGAAVLLSVAAVLVFRHGIVVNRFPAYLEGTDHTDITRYSGPWLGGGLGLGMLALLQLTLGVVGIVRWYMSHQAARDLRPTTTPPVG